MCPLSMQEMDELGSGKVAVITVLGTAIVSLTRS